MGVPAFFRWLSRKYPSIVVHCTEEKAQYMDGHSVPVDATQPNPNDIEFDNLYLDMNGIIHPCCHPEDKAPPKDEEEMMEAIFEYIDRIFNIIRPRRLLYMAIDGVAPRAKMNQQRSRRFRSAKEGSEKLLQVKSIRDDLLARGCELPPIKPDSEHFDSNCITPGTEFMANLAICLQFYIHQRMNGNPAWQGIKVILSDANVPGEGEHKIMDYIRDQRAQPDHDPNTHHCLYGADADLIMLGLATHEPHFTILREEFKPNQPKPCDICGQLGHSMQDCTGGARQRAGEHDQFASSAGCMEKQFIFIRLPVLREYLERELRIDGLPFAYDLERAIDDWVFLCFFVGNDFLPHLPSLQIREGAIDRLVNLYKTIVPQTKGYLTHNGKVNLTRVQLIMTDLGMVEDEIFQRRRVDDVRYRERERAKKRRSDPGPRFVPGGQFAPTRLGSQPNPVMNARQEAAQMRRHASSLSANQTAAESMKGWLRKGNDPSGGSSDQSGGVAGQKRKHEQSACAEDDDEPDDDVRFWEDGWKERYYNNKFGVPSTDEEFVADVVKEYVRGLCWVLGYYYQGCPCWKWFYPYHYAPFSSDCRNISRIQSDFARGTLPFRPLEQLMGVFPAASGKFLPPSWRKLMMDEDSRIIDFYPIDFRIDLNGKKYAWQGVALLPFVDEERLKKSLDPVYSDLSPDEVARNSLGSDLIFVYRHNRLYPFLKTIYESYQRNSEENEPVELNPKHTGGVRGTVSCDEGMVKIMNDGGNVTSPLPQLPHVRPTYVMGAKYQNPQYPLDYVHEAVLLPGITMPEKSLRPGGWKNRTPGSYRPQTGFTPPSRAHSYHTPEPAQRMINRSLSDPRHHYGAQPSHPHSRQFQTPSHRGGYDAQQHYYRGSRDHASPGPRQSWNSAPPRAAWHALPPPPAPYHASQYPPPPPPPGNPTGGYFLPPRQQPRPPRPNPYQWDRY